MAMSMGMPSSSVTVEAGSVGNPKSHTKEIFYRYFQDEVTTLQEQMSHLENMGLVGGERQDAIDYILAGIARLSSEVSDASDYLPAYDQRTYSEAIKALTEKLHETRTKITPKPRFSFKNTQKNGSAISLTDAAELATAQRPLASVKYSGFGSSNESSIAGTPAHLKTPPNEPDTISDLPSFSGKNYNIELSQPRDSKVRKPSFSQASNVMISGHTGLHIILPSTASRATASGAITDLDNCVVDMSIPTSHGAPFAGLTLKNIKKSLVVVGQVAGAAHITGVEDSVIAVTSRQVRMHDCKNVDVYLFCSSRPIIEDCSNIRVAPIPNCYLSSLENSTANKWDQVDDFKWLKAEHSPNWKIIIPEERLPEETWSTVVPGLPGASVEGTLERMGVKA